MKLDSLHQLVEQLIVQVNERFTPHTGSSPAAHTLSAPSLSAPSLSAPSSSPHETQAVVADSTPQTSLSGEKEQWLEETNELLDAELLHSDTMPLNYAEFTQQNLTHKDILNDEENWKKLSDYHYQPDEQEFAPDLQVRRLTAQVTAAYNRIAALEEQLLARRGGQENPSPQNPPTPKLGSHHPPTQKHYLSANAPTEKQHR
ncbi:hypothetical protein PN462_02175 [Spirulina sp. CS-785/01]|uniref:hypothetical protein n=1 Tax=Spirulina sp. CS-785/01 TaxID=3021716 RepID=UPI00232FD309|nr:hypothetical protein [Spirulina sp. CS-785/01]MDB9311893.1 hypothetical protein [Spirulina sp. CS-785/01]